MPVLRHLHMSPFAIIALALILARAIAELWLSRLNQRHVRAHADKVPPAFREMVDEPTYRRSVDYTLAKNRFGDVVTLFDAVLLITVLFSGILSWGFVRFTATYGTSVLAMAGFLFATGFALSIVSLPFAWYAQFKLEDRFGFNTTTVKTWVLDRLKGFLLAVLLGFPLLALVLKLIEWAGPNWWIWAAAAVIAFQLLLLLIAPAVIMPLFNKFTPLPDGSTLRERLFALARRTDFPTRSIEVMDGSKRSHHSNTFFTGFGRFRKIVLFDTLVTQLAEPELESVLAHEIGHYKKRHVVKLLGVSIFGVFMGFAAVAWLARQQWFYRAFGFEYHADAFARATMGDAQPLIQALRKLTEKNLSNLTPHPLYSGFYYSHPTLLERERALQTAG